MPLTSLNLTSGQALRTLLCIIALVLTVPARADLEHGLLAYRNYAYTLAREEFLESAREGHAEAQYYLGEIYEGGIGPDIDIDYRQAFNWYRKAANQGHARAQQRLGKLYLDGRGTESDPRRAFLWLQRAAENGDVLSQYRLGRLYVEGLGTGQDQVAAYRWWTIASHYGEPDAAVGLQALRGSLSRQQREQAERAALAWERRWDAGDHHDEHAAMRPQ